jgi:DNA-directed RNA polymerase specialized sigma24 family protein
VKKIRKQRALLHQMLVNANGHESLRSWLCGIVLFFGGIPCMLHAEVWLRMGPKEPSQSEMPVRPSRDLLERCRKGDDAAISQVYAKSFPQLVRFVMSLGAAQSDAESIAAEVLGDCLVGGVAKRALILDFQEGAALTTWLCTICRNRYYEGFRKRKFVRGGDAWELEEGVPMHVEEAWDEGLIEAARRSLREAFSKCEARDLVLLELVHGHRVDQRRLARLLGWTGSKLSRHLASLRQRIHRRVREAVWRGDGELRLEWRDFVDACETLLKRT